MRTGTFLRHFMHGLALVAIAGCTDVLGPSLGDDARRASLAAIPAGEVLGSTKAAESFEVRFLTGMIDHHAMAVEMALLCDPRASHAELEAMGETIVATQRTEIATMQGWLQDWYGITHEPAMTPGAMRQLEHLASLEGEKFEIAFMEMMIRHHLRAVREAEHCLDRAVHAELRELCEEMRMAQLTEIKTMQGWLCDWYAICRGAKP